MSNFKFEQAKNKLITTASNKAAEYLLSKYGSAHLVGEPKVELSHQDGPTGGTYEFSGTIQVKADVEMNKGYSQVGVNMTVGNNDIEVDSETTIQDRVESALNGAAEYLPTDEIMTASLDSFQLTDRGDSYLLVSHASVQGASIGVLGKNEYDKSPNKEALLKSMLIDSMVRIASEVTSIDFTGSFVEPTITKMADVEPIEKVTKIAAQYPIEKPVEPKKSWLTADIHWEGENEPPMSGAEFMEYFCPVCKEQFEDHDLNMHDKACPGTPEVMTSDTEVPTLSIKEDMPKAHMSDSMSQMAQLEAQTKAAAEDKIKNEVVNSVTSMLHFYGYGTAKVAEITASNSGFDVMTTLDADGTVKAVNIPVEVKESKVVLPKKSLVATLVSKGLDIRARLSEDFSKEILEKISAIDEKVAFEAAEAQSILNEKPTVTKQASDSSNTQFLGDTETLTIQKHLLPGWEDLKEGDKVSDGNDQWEIFDIHAQQNSKGDEDSSLWKLRKCAPPKSDEKTPEVKMSL